MSGHGHHDHSPANKRIALLISALALILALSETLAKGAQTEALSQNVQASNLWSFYQAKTVRQTVLKAQAEAVEAASLPGEKVGAQVKAWRDTAARYESEPEKGEGRKELMARAKDAEAKRDQSLAAYHQYELASALVQIAIVLASSTIITGVAVLAWVGGALGLGGLVFSAIGFFAPTAVHLF